jgi:ABC-type multidrug transport system fused ATPase/permease subunit
MLSIYRKLNDLLDARERRLAWLVFALMLITAMLETVGVASVMPFISVLSNPDVVQNNRFLNSIYEFLGFQSTDAFLLFLGVVVFLFLVGSLAFKGFTFWAQIRYSHLRNHALGCRLIARYLGQPYHWFLDRHTANLSTTLLAEVNRVVQGAMFPAMQVIANGLVVVFLLTFMVLIDPLLAAVAAVALGGIYSVIYLLTRHYLARIGDERLRANRERFHVVQEAFGGIKDVKIAGLEDTLVGRFRNPSRRLAHKEVAAKTLSEIPSFAMQAVVFGGMMLVLLYLMMTRGSLQEALPVLAAYGFAGYRLMPALQTVYRQVSTLRFSVPTLESLHADIQSLDPVDSQEGLQRDEHGKPRRLGLSDRLELRDVHYAYPNADREALRGISLSVDAYTTVGLVGATGSGKTTTVDLILGLLRPSSGALIADGKPIDRSNIRSWQRSLGYVPQHIFLSDETVAANIAFGIRPADIDHDAVERAARVANLHDFVINELQDGYETRVGERGVRLSGGQRQRIGIARAMYHDPDVLILDEATSALDNVTERAVMDAVHNLGSRKTIILIAHRLSTVRSCDRIFLLEHGQLIADGTYDELVSENEKFRQMATGS